MFEGRRVVITGAAGGISRYLCRACANMPDTVSGNHLSNLPLKNETP